MLVGRYVPLAVNRGNDPHPGGLIERDMNPSASRLHFGAVEHARQSDPEVAAVRLVAPILAAYRARALRPEFF